MADSLLGGVLGSAIGAASSAYMARKQYEWNKEMYQNRYQWTVADMEKAGLNPILAASSGGFGVSTPSVGTEAVASGPDLNTAKAQRDALKLEEKRLEQQDMKLSIDADNAEASKVSAYALRDSVDSQREVNQSLIGMNTEQMNLNIANTGKSYAETASIYQHIQNEVRQTQALIEYYGSETNLNYLKGLSEEARKEEIKKQTEVFGEKIKNLAALTGKYEIEADDIAYDLQTRITKGRLDDYEYVFSSDLGHALSMLGIGFGLINPLGSFIKDVK